MKHIHQKVGYTILIVPEGIGHTKSIQLKKNYRPILVGIAIVCMLAISVVGISCYKQHMKIQAYEAALLQKEGALLQKDQEMNVLKNQQSELEIQMAQMKTSLEEVQATNKQLQMQKKANVSSVKLAPPKPVALKGEGGVDEETLKEYIPTFKPCEGEITSLFGKRTNPFTKKANQMHKGIDISNKTGTPIYAAASGMIEEAGYLNGYGYAIYIDHGNGIQTRYGHNSKLLVKVGDEVKKGQLIAKMGSTGNSTGPHLHFEILDHEKQVDPSKLFE